MLSFHSLQADCNTAMHRYEMLSYTASQADCSIAI